VGLEDRQIKYLSGTHEGKKHDKKICDEEKIRGPEGSDLYQDSGFQGLEIEGVRTHQPKKKPKGGELTAEEKEHNRLISGIRIVVEHVIAGVKRCRIVKEVFRNTKLRYDDLVMELACGLHNFRSGCRLNAY
jgi:DDE superfamily endonuclease